MNEHVINLFDYDSITHKSYSMLKTFDHSPEMYYYKYILKCIPDEPTPQMEFGSAFHNLVLYGQDKFNEMYYSDKEIIIEPGMTRAKKEYKERLEKLREEKVDKYKDAKFLKYEDLEHLDNMYSSIRASTGSIRKVLSDGKKQVEKQIITTIDGMYLKGTIDLIDFDNKIIVDLKTTQDITSFEKDANNYRYFIQQALYKQLAKKMYKQNFDFIFIVIEKKFPYLCDVFYFSPVDDDISWELIKQLYEELLECEQKNSFIKAKEPKAIQILPWSLKKTR